MKFIHLSLILPCYNEEPIFVESANTIYQTLKKTGFSFEIIFVDDGSSDHTVRLIKMFCKKYRQCRFIVHTTNQGRGAAVTTGMKAARGEIVGYIDIDCEVSPLYITGIVSLMDEGNIDMVIGKRIYRGGPESWGREVLSTGYRWMVSFFLGTKGIDTESGYKFFQKKKIVSILPLVQNRHWFWDTEVVVFAIRKKLKLREYPVLFVRRPDKKSSVRIVSDTADYLIQIYRLCMRFQRKK